MDVGFEIILALLIPALKVTQAELKTLQSDPKEFVNSSNDISNG
jgi:hypothetical protein